LPDFIIGGAMKSGTSTLRYLLRRHPEVFLPDHEIHFFSLDDIVQHPDFVGPVNGTWIERDYERDFARNLAWYTAHFSPARAEQIVGEDSTVYLASSRAAERIRRLVPDVRLIFLLRDPVARAYSHYWHQVRSGRATRSFENTLRYQPHAILTRGFYRAQLEAYLRHFPRAQIKVLLFERFVADVQGGLDEVTRFLGLRASVDVTGLVTHQHRGDAPRSPRLRLLQNRLLHPAAAAGMLPDLPGGPAPRLPPMARLAVRVDGYLQRLNPFDRSYPPMGARVRSFLEALFARENAGLSELIGLDVKSSWPYFPG
jgi:hypothetical protein